jgi:hypothetical protein
VGLGADHDSSVRAARKNNRPPRTLRKSFVACLDATSWSGFEFARIWEMKYPVGGRLFRPGLCMPLARIPAFLLLSNALSKAFSPEIFTLLAIRESRSTCKSARKFNDLHSIAPVPVHPPVDALHFIQNTPHTILNF